MLARERARWRFVHFKVKELLRRVWGDYDEGMTISARNLSEHWTTFALYWGLWLHGSLLGPVSEILGDIDEFELDGDRLDQAMAMLGPEVPIITPEEVVGPWGRPWD